MLCQSVKLQHGLIGAESNIYVLARRKTPVNLENLDCLLGHGLYEEDSKKSNIVCNDVEDYFRRDLALYTDLHDRWQNMIIFTPD